MKNNTFRKRFDFSKIPATIQIPNLIEVQSALTTAFCRWTNCPASAKTAVQAVFQSVFPITDFRNDHNSVCGIRHRKLGVQVRPPERAAPPAHHL